jgi:hypothetical protein
MSAFLRHPLLHFLTLGALVFALHSALRPTADNVIHVSDALIAAMRSDLQRRGETDENSLEAAITAYTEEEILLREARRLGLDQGDPIIRRRLAQVMRFFLAESAPQSDPSEEDLRAHLVANAARYAQPARVSFEHHFFVGDRALERRAAAAEALAHEQPAKADAFAHGNRLIGQNKTRLDQRFGPGFARQIMQLAVGPTWHEIESTYGLHLLRLNAHDAAGTAKLEEVASAVRKDWLRQQNQRLIVAAIKELRARYSVQRP